ncbi:calcium-binding protein [Phenylobacterium sp. 20VBR1]|uniref:Calcium-binding protein n=1 Tax=Phenylobacterium glaciei TaxID=2803784 RepID=A0A941D391_9CAUL|nr:calcium-binding protein [Phenylobacterium glaciei]MBR7621500.1 calcium-binding protein [Phenylobacterium glaciei]
MFLNGGSGKDKLTGGAGADTLYGLGGDDSLSGLGGEDVLTGGDGNDTLSGGANDDYLMGDLGNDRIDGGTGNDWAGYENASSAVKVDLALTTAQNTLGAGTDQLVSIEYVHGSAYADTLSGTSGANYIFGGSGNDSLVGRAGDDFLAGGAGDDTIDGGANDDTVSFDDGVAGGVVVSLLTQTADGHGHDNLISIESVYGSGDADSIVGNDVDNYLFGGAGADTIVAGGGADYVDGDAGNDLILAGAGDDNIAGGAGIDTVSFDDGVVGGVTVSLATQTAEGHGHDSLISIENVIGSAYSDNITGDASNNFLSGGGDNDTIFGGDGDDLLASGLGRNLLDGGAGLDTVTYQGGVEAIYVNLTTAYAISGSGGTYDLLSSIENVRGTDFDDDITGDGGSNYLVGGGGRDHLDAGAGGADTLEGGAGDDYITIGDQSSSNILFVGGEGKDALVFFGGGPNLGAGVTLDLAATGSQQIGAGHTLTLSSVEDVYGTEGADTIYASDATNTLLSFGGADHFVFRTLAELGNGDQADVIYGAEWHPIIDVSAIDADTTLAGNQAFQLLAAGAGFTGHAGEAIQLWDATWGGYVVQFDVNGDSVADAALRFTTYGPPAGSSQFIL